MRGIRDARPRAGAGAWGLVCVHVHACACVCAHARVFSCVFLGDFYLRMFVCVCVRMYVCVRVCVWFVSAVGGMRARARAFITRVFRCLALRVYLL